MPSKKHKPEEIIGKLREVEIVLGQGGMPRGDEDETPASIKMRLRLGGLA